MNSDLVIMGSGKAAAESESEALTVGFGGECKIFTLRQSMNVTHNVGSSCFYANPTSIWKQRTYADGGIITLLSGQISLYQSRVKFENDPITFSDRNGVIDNFAVVVSESGEDMVSPDH